MNASGSFCVRYRFSMAVCTVSMGQPRHALFFSAAGAKRHGCRALQSSSSGRISLQKIPLA